jgi:hypothetical protein
MGEEMLQIQDFNPKYGSFRDPPADGEPKWALGVTHEMTLDDHSCFHSKNPLRS